MRSPPLPLITETILNKQPTSLFLIKGCNQVIQAHLNTPKHTIHTHKCTKSHVKYTHPHKCTYTHTYTSIRSHTYTHKNEQGHTHTHTHTYMHAPYLLQLFHVHLHGQLLTHLPTYGPRLPIRKDTTLDTETNNRAQTDPPMTRSSIAIPPLSHEQSPIIHNLQSHCRGYFKSEFIFKTICFAYSLCVATALRKLPHFPYRYCPYSTYVAEFVHQYPCHHPIVFLPSKLSTDLRYLY